nr:synaptobrevin, longin-like domain protein [Tanacetum cinerariifolium]
MSAKRTSWNEFSSTMASTIICLSTGVDFLPNEEIFAELARMGYEKPSTKLTFYKAFFSSQWKFLIYTILQSLSAKCTSWNKFSSAMASAIICLSTDQNFNFSKYIFESLVHDDIDDAAAQGADTAVEGDDVHEPSIPSLTPPPQQSQDLPSTSQVQHTPLPSPFPKSQPPPQTQHQAADFPMSLLQEALDACTALTRRVEHLEIESSDDNEMEDASNQGRMTDVLMVDKEDEKKTKEAMGDGDDQVKGRQADIYKIDMDHESKVLKVVTAASTTIAAAEPQVPTATITAALSKDKGNEIMVEEPKPMKKKQQIEMDEEYVRKLHKELNKDIDWDVSIDHVKQKAKEDLANLSTNFSRRSAQFSMQPLGIWSNHPLAGLSKVVPTRSIYSRRLVSVSGEVSDLGLLDEDNTCWMVSLPSSSSGYVTSLSDRVLM